MSTPRSDALVFFGATGDLACKKIFPSLQAMIGRGNLDVPVIGVAKAGWSLDQMKGRAKDSLEKHGGLDPAAFATLSGLLRYVDGEYNDLMEPFWNRNYMESVQITMAENFGVQGRGAFYDETGTVRDVIQNHLFQVLCNLAMEPPVRTDSESIRDEKVKVLKAIPTLEAGSIIRGQFTGYLSEPGVAKGSKTETFAALKLEIDSWRRKGVPFYIRAGKLLPVTCTEVFGRLKKPPTVIKERTPVYDYAPGTWGPAEAEQRLSPPGGWNDPIVSEKAEQRERQTS